MLLKEMCIILSEYTFYLSNFMMMTLRVAAIFIALVTKARGDGVGVDNHASKLVHTFLNYMILQSVPILLEIVC